MPTEEAGAARGAVENIVDEHDDDEHDVATRTRELAALHRARELARELADRAADAGDLDAAAAVAARYRVMVTTHVTRGDVTVTTTVTPYDEAEDPRQPGPDDD